MNGWEIRDVGERPSASRWMILLRISVMSSTSALVVVAAAAHCAVKQLTPRH